MPIFKQATSDSEYEEQFFSLAQQALEDKLSNLLPYLVGFEMVDKRDDGTKALGVFGFQSPNGQVLYVPVFFINGSIKGLDLLYSKNNEQFLPLNENFAEIFLKDNASGLGTASKQSLSEVKRETPNSDLLDMVRPPRTGKYSYASDNTEAWRNEDFMSLFTKESSTNDPDSLMRFLRKGGNKIKKAFLNLLEKNGEYFQAVTRFYDFEKLAEVLTPDQLPGKKYREDSKDIEITYPDSANVKGLSPENKKSLMSEGYIILDKRKDEDKSKFGPIKFVEQFNSPEKSGIYPYITQHGDVRIGIILMRLNQIQEQGSTNDTIVIDLDGKKSQAYLVDDKQVFVKDQIHVQDYDVVHQMFQDINTVKPSFGKTYILISDKLKASVPFEIISNYTDSHGVRHIGVEPYSQYQSQSCDSHDQNVYNPNMQEYGGGISRADSVNSAREVRKGSNSFRYTKKAKRLNLVVTKQPGETISIRGENVYVPQGFKLLELNFDIPHPHRRESYLSNLADDSVVISDKTREKNESYETWLQGKPGSRSALQAALYEKNVHPMTVNANGSDYYVNISDLRKSYGSKMEAKIGMVKDVGLDVKVASGLIDNLKSSKTIKGYVKLAALGSKTPYYFDEVPYTNDLGLPTTSGIGMEFEQPPDNYYTDDPTDIRKGTVKNDIEGNDSGNNQQEGNSAQQAIQMAQGGQKEIFDTASISTLARYVSPSNKINEFMPDLITALDKLGRMVFLVHWETKKFQEMYGRSDMPQLIELLTDVFKNLGDLVIFLKKQSPEIDINMSQKDVLDV